MRSTPKPCRDTNVLNSFVETSSTAVLPARRISMPKWNIADGVEPRPFWTTHARLKGEYEVRL